MKNSQLQTLLARTPLCEEDIYNVTVIFEALSEERKIHILNHWEKYVAKLILEREKLDKTREKEIIKTLKQANTLLDEAILRMNEKNFQKEEMKRQTQENLASADLYESMKKSKNLREIARNIGK